MVNPNAIKELISSFPISGDVVVQINTTHVFYQSGATLPIPCLAGMTKNNKVVGIISFYYEPIEKLFIGINHVSPLGKITENYIYLEDNILISELRRLKLNKFFNKSHFKVKINIP